MHCICHMIMGLMWPLRVRDSRQCNRKYVDALWQWRRVKTSTDSVGQSLQKEFLIDDTGMIEEIYATSF